jgi:glycerate 2-kinase
MNILICPDKFKESLTSAEVARFIKKGLIRGIPDAEYQVIPLADGGEGTVEALVEATHGHTEKVSVSDPLMRPVEARFGISGDEETAIIEMAAASGMALLKPTERHPMVATSYGTGLLIRHALNCNLRQMIIGIGGSATVDGGVGMAQALGMKFLDEEGKEIPLGAGGGILGKIAHIDASRFDYRISDTRIAVACDVDNLLTGPDGAARVFGPQKGADEEMVEILEQNLIHLAAIINLDLHRNISQLKGGGAAGGLGAGLVAFLNAELKNGFNLVSDFVKLEKLVDWADLIITGEGKMDEQTSFGKTPAGVARLARQKKKPVIGITGTLGDHFGKLYELGFSALVPISDRPMSLEQCIFNAPKLIEDACERVAFILRLGKELEW